ncbi:MAG: hypothetical protein N2Z23_03685 [Pyrinomonadaceae bacterium]|nr:hypothetical protein [Pyrinomonadaceae bacterium]
MRKESANWIEKSEEGWEKVSVRTTILVKNNMIGLLGLKTAPIGGMICRIDPREPSPAIKVYNDPEAATEWFIKSLRTSQENGWRIVYDGLPLYG